MGQGLSLSTTSLDIRLIIWTISSHSNDVYFSVMLSIFTFIRKGESYRVCKKTPVCVCQAIEGTKGSVSFEKLWKFPFRWAQKPTPLGKRHDCGSHWRCYSFASISMKRLINEKFLTCQVLTCQLLTKMSRLLTKMSRLLTKMSTLLTFKKWQIFSIFKMLLTFSCFNFNFILDFNIFCS